MKNLNKKKTRGRTSDLYLNSYWSREDYKKVIIEIAKKPKYYHAVQLIYYCGLRVEEMLALTPADFDFNQKVVSITKAYRKFKNEEMITGTKVKGAERKIYMPDAIAEEMKKYLEEETQLQETDRVFDFSKYALKLVVDRGADSAGIGRTQLHEIRRLGLQVVEADAYVRKD